MNHDFNELIKLVRSGKPQNPMEVQGIVEKYFSYIHWSLLKEEYEVSMSEDERTLFIEKLFNQVRSENNDESRRHS